VSESAQNTPAPTVTGLLRPDEFLDSTGSLEPVHNAVDIAELAADKGAQTLLLPVSCRRQLNDLSDDLAARLTIVYYLDGRDALLKALMD
jgi:ATP-dependent Lon protease